MKLMEFAKISHEKLRIAMDALAKIAEHGEVAIDAIKKIDPEGLSPWAKWSKFPDTPKRKYKDVLDFVSNAPWFEGEE